MPDVGIFLVNRLQNCGNTLFVNVYTLNLSSLMFRMGAECTDISVLRLKDMWLEGGKARATFPATLLLVPE